jgi:hypothetical protein
LSGFTAFQVKVLVREYNFTVRQAPGGLRAFRRSTENEAYRRPVRWQDTPDGSRLRPQGKCADANHPPIAQCRITDREFEEYCYPHFFPGRKFV